MQNKSVSFYEKIGGEDGINRLLTAYMTVLREEPAAHKLYALYKSHSITRYEARMREFLSGWLGGPAIYQARHGMPMLREGHRSIHITAELMQQWVHCMRKALDATVEDQALRLKLFGVFMRMAQSLVNTKAEALPTPSHS